MTCIWLQPIVSGVIEGACRRFIKAGRERSRMRWTVEHAQAALHLRSTCLNGERLGFYLSHQTKRVYPHRNIIETTPWKMAA